MTTLTMKDEKRLDVIQRVYRSELTVVEVARVMGLSRSARGRVYHRSIMPLVLRRCSGADVFARRSDPFKNIVFADR